MQQIEVAIAVIHYAQHYLLSFRDAQQHQGNRYEFVGGKLDPNESPLQALIREVQEEIGLDISQGSQINPLGVLRHTYSDLTAKKQVCLHVFRVQLSKFQYLQQLKYTQGQEGQALTWVDLPDLLAQHYQLPEANKSILAWLQLGDCISITYDLDAFNSLVYFDLATFSSKNTANTAKNSTSQVNQLSQHAQHWLNYYTRHLPVNGWVYVRLKQVDMQEQQHMLLQLIQRRADVQLIVNSQLAKALQRSGQMPTQIRAQHLTQAQLMQAHRQIQAQAHVDCHEQSNSSIAILPDLPITVSCHDATSIEQLNDLARYRLNQRLSVVIGAYISPVLPTKSHPERDALGWQKFAQMAQLAEVPVIALGGMMPADLCQVRYHQGDKVAGIRQFLV
ncbi:NUDIX domain-containing protein [Psychrobacter lutiphocae]|uniref:NUDIX domain-containing protein n=1 Tax=Psychrobacter lutiphocae TaxID=540500 RepID=UPI000375DE38|nr:NUDIX domain-containing protein [Psychrobacter lutiphocae]